MKKESTLNTNFKLEVETRSLNTNLCKILTTKKGSLFSEQMEQSTEDIPVEPPPPPPPPPSPPPPPPDPFQDLRYDEALASRKIPKLHIWDPVVSVLVKRPLAYQPPVEVAKPFTLGLQLPVDEKKQTLRLYEPFTRFTRSKVETLKRDKVQQPWYQNPILRKELEKQEHALHAWKDSLELSARTTAWISKKIGRPAAKLLLNTPLRLPPPKNHQGTSYGSEHDFPKVKHVKRFYHSDAFFWMPQSVGPAEFSIHTSPTWTERKFYKPPLTIARPRLDDTLPTCSRVEKRHQEITRAPLQKIVVKGAAAQLRCPPLVPQCSLDDDRGNKETSEKVPSPQRAISHSVHSTACLMVEGNMYNWGEPCPEDLVEVGFVCVAGQRAYNEIRLANMGKTVIRCVWCKTLHSNHFNKGHYSGDHFAFDCSDRILLPLDWVTLKVQFHADYPGFWREVWYLKTEPALGPDGSSNIPISLWARALASDDNDCRRRELERQLDVLVANRIAARYKNQVLSNLPHRDYGTILRERLSVTEDIFVVDDVKLFEQANPGLSYHGHAMFTIVKLYRKVRKLRSLKTKIDLVRDTKKLLLERQPTIPQKTEESREREKMPVVLSPKRMTLCAYTAALVCTLKVGEAKRRRASKKSEPKKDVIVAEMSSITQEGSRKTEVDELLEGNPAYQDRLERRNITVEGLHKMIGGLDERLEEKNSMLMELNQAVRDMSFHRDQPNVPNFKHLVCRTALCQAADDVAAIAHRLSHDTRLVTISTGSVNNEVKMVTPYRQTSKGEKADMLNTKEDVQHRRQGSKRSIVKTKRLSKFNGSRHFSQSQYDLTKDLSPVISDDVVASSGEMYRKGLFVLVHERVERLLLDLLPLMTCDEPQLDLLKPRPEL